MANRMSKQLHPDLAEAQKAHDNHDNKDVQKAREGWSEDNNGDLDDCGAEGPQNGRGQYIPDKGDKHG